MIMFGMVNWIISSGSEVQVRSSRRRVAIYADPAASRRLVLGLDNSGLPVCGIPYVDRDLWMDFTWSKIIFASGIIPVEKLPLYDNAYLGFMGIDHKKDPVVLWTPVQDERLFAGLLAAPEKFNSKPGIIRLISYSMMNDRPAWIPDQDLDVLDLLSINGVALTPDAAWEVAAPAAKRSAASAGQAGTAKKIQGKPASGKSSKAKSSSAAGLRRQG
jgi:hypothetical protein